MKYKVQRSHQGDKWYDPGDMREANPAEVAHLVRSGTLVEVAAKAAAAPKNKAVASAPKNKKASA